MALSYEYSDAESYYVALVLLIIVAPVLTLYVASRPDHDEQERILAKRRAEGKAGRDEGAPLCPCSACREQAKQRESFADAMTRESPIGVAKPTHDSSLWHKFQYYFVSSFELWNMALGLVWAQLLWTVYKIFTAGKQVLTFDPHAILGVSESASKSEVRKAFRALSLTEHPDKVAAHLRAAAETKYAQITKAYKVLTDAKAWANFEKYGSPDGPQAAAWGVALPSWMNNTALVVCLYIGVLAAVGFAAYRYLKHGSVLGSRAANLDNGLQKEPVEKLAASFKASPATSPFLTVDNCLTMVAGVARAHHADLAPSPDALAKLPKPALHMSANPAMQLLQLHLHRTPGASVPAKFVETCDKAADAVLALAMHRGRAQDIVPALAVSRLIVSATTLGDARLAGALPHVSPAAAARAGWAKDGVTPVLVYKQGRAAFDKALAAANAGLTAQQRDEAWRALGDQPHVAVLGCSFGDMSLGQTPGNETQAHADSDEVAVTVKLLVTTVRDYAVNGAGAASADKEKERTGSPAKARKGAKSPEPAATSTAVAADSAATPPAVLARQMPAAYTHAPHFPTLKRAGFWLLLSETSRGAKAPAPLLNAGFIAYDDPALEVARDDTTGVVHVRVGMKGPKVAGQFALGLHIIGHPTGCVEESRTFKLRLERWGKKQRIAAGVEDDAARGKDAEGKYRVVELPAPKDRQQGAGALAQGEPLEQQQDDAKVGKFE